MTKNANSKIDNFTIALSINNCFSDDTSGNYLGWENNCSDMENNWIEFQDDSEIIQTEV